MASSHGRLLVILCSLLLVLRIGGAHLHLCFDGQEPPATVHVLDAVEEEHTPSVASSHHDENIDLAGNGLIRATQSDFQFPPAVLAALAILFLIHAKPRVPRAERILEAVASHLDELRPPLRGPPMTART